MNEGEVSVESLEGMLHTPTCYIKHHTGSHTALAQGAL